MVDHEPIPESTLIQAKLAFRVVAPTLFGINEFRRNDVDAVYIPFGVNTGVYKPPEDKTALKPWVGQRGVPFDTRAQTQISEDSFLIMMNGANKDPYRKAFMPMFNAIRIFLEQNPDAKRVTRVYVHSWMKQARDIPHGAKTLKIQNLCRGTSDIHNLCSVPEAAMAKLYGASDVFMHLSEGGGFEIPPLEALACGVPVIGSDFVGMSELIRGHGWLVPMKTKYYSPLDALQGVADEYKAADALEDAYNHPEKRESFGKVGREFALKFDWSNINPLWIGLFESIRSEWRQTPIQERMI
jgi:glycosyltransferase involved in cell wall biosynthesis